MATDNFLNPVKPNTISVSGNLLDRSSGFLGDGWTGFGDSFKDIFEDLDFMGRDQFGNLLDEATQGWIDKADLGGILDDLFLGESSDTKKVFTLPKNIAIDMVDDAPISSVVIECIEEYALNESVLFDPLKYNVPVTNENGDSVKGLRDKLNKLQLMQALGTGGDFIDDLVAKATSELKSLLNISTGIETGDEDRQDQLDNIGGFSAAISALSVRLAMPGDIENSISQDWSASETGALGADIAANIIKATADVSKTEGMIDKLNVLGVTTKGVFNTDTAATQHKMKMGVWGTVLGDDAKNLMLHTSKKIVNTKRKVLYRGHNFRSFSFKFDFTPKNAKDVGKTMALIKGLKYFSSPGLQGNSEFLQYPSLFKISFLNKMGVEASESFGMSLANCAMTSMKVNYTPDGLWQTFRNGFPVHVSMTLGFQETELLYRQNITATRSVEQGGHGGILAGKME